MMKISKCKKELARIISEHGGWRDGAKLAVFGPVSKKVRFSRHHEKPVTLHKSRGLGRGWEIVGQFDSWMESESIHVGKPFRNWHQTILSRAEYFHLYPAPDADGWIEWSGMPRSPVSKGTQVDVKMQNGTQHFGQLIDDECWSDCWGDANIIAYRLHKPEQAKPEFCESVMGSIPEPEAKPTLDQLLQDWRNADDFAQRKQAEADEAAAMRDERWKVVQARAGEMGVTVGRCESAVATDEPELVITDWRNLLVGDEIEVVESKSSRYVGLVGVVSRFDEGDELQPVRVIFGGSECNYDWPAKWRFIRRP